MMLPREFLRTRRRRGSIRPVYAADDKLSLAKTLISVFREHVGRRRGELGNALASCEELGYNYKLVRGLAAVLEKRCAFETRAAVEPVEARLAVFREAGNRVVATEGDRRRVLSAVAFRLGVSTENLDASLHADLWNEHVLVNFDSLDPGEFLKEYNFASTIALLTEASRLELTYMGEDEDLDLLEDRLGGRRNRTSDGLTRVVIKRRPSRRTGRLEEDLERLTFRLMLMEAWRLEAEVERASRTRKTHLLELSKESDSGLITPSDLKRRLEPKPKKGSGASGSSFGDIVVVDDLASRLGVTVAEAGRRLEASGRRYVELSGIFIASEKLEEVEGRLEAADDMSLSEAADVLRLMGCRRPLPVLEALGYAVEWAEDRDRSRVYRLRRHRTTP